MWGCFGRLISMLYISYIWGLDGTKKGTFDFSQNVIKIPSGDFKFTSSFRRVLGVVSFCLVSFWKFVKHHQVTSTPKTLRKLAWNHLTVFWLNFEKNRRFLFVLHGPSPTYIPFFDWMNVLWNPVRKFNKIHFWNTILWCQRQVTTERIPMSTSLAISSESLCMNTNLPGPSFLCVLLVPVTISLSFGEKAACVEWYNVGKSPLFLRFTAMKRRFIILEDNYRATNV